MEFYLQDSDQWVSEFYQILKFSCNSAISAIIAENLRGESFLVRSKSSFLTALPSLPDSPTASRGRSPLSSFGFAEARICILIATVAIGRTQLRLRLIW